ncbi:MAG: flagellar basal body rod protein FlgC [Planctomycetota bacterium]
MSGIDRLFSGMRASSTGLAAERTRIDVIAENIANARTTRTPGGGPYRRKMVRFEPILREVGGDSRAAGVRAAGIESDYQTPFDVVHDPGHPDRDAEGFVRFPNVSTVMEMTDLITAMRAYEANLTVQQNFMQMAERALQVAR